MMGQVYSRRKFLLQLIYGGAGAYLACQSGIPGFSDILGANDRVRIGIVGLGAKGLNHLNHFIQIPGVEVCAISDLDESNLRAATAVVQQARLPVPIATTDYRHLADLKNLDAVSIAVPKAKRVGMAMDFCSAGKDILIERPFSLSAREGKQLVKAAEESGRVIQQKDDAFPFSLTEEISPITMAALGGITHVKAWTSVEHTRDRSPGANGSQHSLVEDAWRELDMARCILEGDVPCKVSTAGVGSANGLNQRIMVDVEYANRPHSTRIQLEVATVNAFGDPDRRKSRLTSVNHYYGPKGRLIVSTDSDQGQLAESISFHNFVECICEQRPGELLNHISEARKSNLLIDLARYSLLENKILAVDPITEDVIAIPA